METLQIKIPEGYEVDTFDMETGLVTFKKKASERWEDNPDNEVVGYSINQNGSVSWHRVFLRYIGHKCIFSTEEQAYSALAKAQLSQIIKNDPRFGGYITIEEWKSLSSKYTIRRVGNGIRTYADTFLWAFLAFHTEEQRDLFFKENEALIKQYFELE